MVWILLAVIAGGISFALSRRIATAAIVATLIGLLTYVTSPMIAWNFGAPWLLALITILLTLLGIYLEIPAYELVTSFKTRNVARSAALAQKHEQERSKKDREKSHITRVAQCDILFILVGVAGFTLNIVSTSFLFHADAKRDVIGQVRDGQFTEEFELIDQSQVRIVDQKLARVRGDELLGTVTGLASRVSIGTFHIQSVNGKLQWVAPLEHDGFWRWWGNKTTPGYIRVSAADLRDAEIVTSLDGKDIALKIGNGGWGSDQLRRYIYQSGFVTTPFANPTFEIDDNGKPFWVATTYTKKVGFDSEDATGVIIVDPQSGDINSYDIAHAPKWVDRIQPESFILDQINDWGEYVHGWPNFYDNDKKKAAEHMSLIYTRDGHSMWYTGIQSIKSATNASGTQSKGTMGFMLIDTRTKAATFYKITGATEDAGREAIEGKVQQFRYTASNPILYNVAGVPTYISTLKDNAGNFKGIGIVSVENRSIVAWGDGLNDAIRKYETALRTEGFGMVVPSSVLHYEFTGKVTRIGSEVTGDTTYYYFTIDTVPNKLFTGNLKLTDEMVVTKVGDAVKITSDDTSKPRVNIVDFDNLGLMFEKTDPIGKRVDLTLKH